MPALKKFKRKITKYKTRRVGKYKRYQRGGSSAKELKKDELAFVSCFYGDDKNEAYEIPPLPSENHNCYFFTNNPKLLEAARKEKWIGILDDKDKPITTDDISSCMYGKEVKAMPHKFPVLANYKFLVFMDSKLEKLDMKIVYDLIDKHLIKDRYALLLRKHVKHDTIWQELDDSLKQERYAKHEKGYRDYINSQMKDGWKDNVKDHAQCGFLIRNMRHPKINELNDMWYKHIQDVGIQDQITFYFVRQRYPDIIKTFTEVPFEKRDTPMPLAQQPLPLFPLGGINLGDLLKHIPFIHLMKHAEVTRR